MGESRQRFGIGRRTWIAISLLLGLIGAATIFHAAAMLGENGTPLSKLANTRIYYAVLIASSVACVLRAVLVKRDRLAWGLIAAGVICTTGGDIVYELLYAGHANQPYPSFADALYLAFYPFVAAGVIVLAARIMGRVDASLMLDGAIAATGAAAIAATFLGPALSTFAAKDLGAAIVDTAYPVGDMVLLGGVAAVAVMVGWRRDFLVLGLGLAVAVTADTIYLHQAATTGYAPGTILDAGWVVSAALIGFAAWQRPPRMTAEPAPRDHSIAMPTLIALSAIGLLVFDHFSRLSAAAVVLAACTLVLILGRLMLAFAENRRLLRTARGHALTDPLTGLGNRRRLMDELNRATETADSGHPYLLAIFDLDGFKSYNDTFGHAAGDHLLRRIGAELDAAVAGRGTAYRLGGDEFCVLAPVGASKPASLVASARAALSEDGEGFSITASQGSATIPAEATAPEEALRLADRRLYIEKGRLPRSLGVQAHDLLLGVLREREPGLETHMEGVSELAIELGRRLGLDAEELDATGRAAALHDIGKMAIPDEILNKPGPLDEREWELMRTHTLIGERMLGASPALLPVATLVRSSHERWDGGGYPDRLAGADIPVGSRIIAICDAFEAMTEVRPYREPVGVDEALAELRRSAGSQFDPELVELFAEVIAGSAECYKPVTSAAPRAPARRL